MELAAGVAGGPMWPVADEARQLSTCWLWLVAVTVACLQLASGLLQYGVAVAVPRLTALLNLGAIHDLASHLTLVAAACSHPGADIVAGKAIILTLLGKNTFPFPQAETQQSASPAAACMGFSRHP